MSEATKGSRKHIQRYVNLHTGRLNELLYSASRDLSADGTGSIQWVSPMAEDNYREYRDDDFLRVLGLERHVSELHRFWPRGGPHWDALAKLCTSEGPGAVLVEAKAHLRETPEDDAAGATNAESLETIEGSLTRARGFSPDTPSWCSPHYQVCNRLAHLYFMNEKLKVPTWLVWLFITNDPDWPDDHADEKQWRDYLDRIYADIGMPANHPLEDKIITVFAPPSEVGET